MKYIKGRKKVLINFVWIVLVLTSGKYAYDTKINNEDWPAYGGNKAGNRYSPLNQININNVKNLKVAWMYNASDKVEEGKRPREIQCQPIVVNGILYGTSPELKLFALKANTGELLWKFDPSAKAQGYNSASRGLNYWESGNDKRILYSAGPHLFAINAVTGKPVETFGTGGKVDLHTGLENDRFDIKDLAVTATSPGVVYKDILVLGSTVSESGDALPGHIRGFNIRTGKLVWTFHTIPQPGDQGYNTWPKDAYKQIGGANSWGGMVLDEKRGMVYLGTGSPSVDFFGGARAGDNLFANCVLALNAETGKMKWYFQTIHHDLWDLDLPSPPNLVRVKHKGKMVDAVAQTTKDGLVYVLDRDSGISLFPIEERSVPTNGLPGESPSPIQKFPLKPRPFVRQVLTEADYPDSVHFPEAYSYAKKRFPETRRGSKYIPPSLEGNWFIGISGGAEWGGNAADPEGILYQNASEVPWDIKMVSLASQLKESTSRGNSLYIANCGGCHGQDRKGNGDIFPSLVDIGKKLSVADINSIMKTGRGRMPSVTTVSDTERDAIVRFLMNAESQSDQAKDEHSFTKLNTKNTESFPYVSPYVRGKGGRVKDVNGYPGIKPPWGTLNAINLNTGEYLWTVPLGEYPELTKKGILGTGTENTGGPIVTAGGLVFISGTEDEKIRAFDKKTGKVVWEYQLPAGAFATPITYQIDGKQYLVIAAGGVRGGHKPGGFYIAFTLP